MFEKIYKKFAKVIGITAGAGIAGAAIVHYMDKSKIKGLEEIISKDTKEIERLSYWNGRLFGQLKGGK